MRKKFKSLLIATSTFAMTVTPFGFVGSASEVDSYLLSETVTENEESIAEESSTNQIIVKYDTTIPSSEAIESVEQLGGEIVKVEDGVALFNVPEENMEQTIEKIQHTEGVDYVENNVAYSIEGTNDTYFENQWNLTSIAAEQAWETTDTAEGDVVVAVLDTGIWGSHEDLAGRVLEGATFVDGYDETYQGDDQGHGTFVSGIIAANANNSTGIAGVAGQANVKILPVKVMNKSGVGYAFNIAKGIEYAVAQGVDVINLSISGEYSESVEQAINKAVDAGIVVVAASGNGGGNADTSYPAALPNVISVGAIASQDQVYSQSNYGSTLDLVAPGVSILSTSIMGDLGAASGYYTTASGTSYATPHVSAVAALYKIKNPTASASEVQEVLTSTATDVNTEGWDEKTGYGKVNAAAALAGDVEIAPLTFTLPKAEADVLAATTIQVALNNPENVATTKFYVDSIADDTFIGEAKGNHSTATIEWDTSSITDGDHTIIAVTYDSTGAQLNRITREVTVRNNPESGYMFTVKTPNDTIAKGATIQVFEKGYDEETETYSYNNLWSGVTDSEGVVRVPSYVGTDLKTLQVIVQGKFDATDEENSWFMYSNEVNTGGAVTLESDNTVAVDLNTLDEEGKSLADAQYFITAKDDNGLTIGTTTAINTENVTESPIIYLDKGVYNLFSYYKTEGKSYFLSNTDTQIKDSTKSIDFDSRQAGEISVDNTDQKLENAVLYLYNDAITEIFGESDIITGQKFYVSPGEYNYLIDTEVADLGGGENWIYVFGNNKEKATVKKGEKTTLNVGGSLEIDQFEPDHESLRNYYTQRGLTYIERDDPYTAYKLDKAFYTKETFSDAYGNKLYGAYRGSITSEDALYKKNVVTGETVLMQDDEATVASVNFGDIYATYQVKRLSDGKIMLNSYTKNPTNPANRQYYFYSFWVTSSADVTAGQYEISLSMDKSPLASNGLNAAMTINMQDSGVNMKLQNASGVNQAAYITINRLVQDEDGGYSWESALASNTDATTKSLSLPTNLELSKVENGNVAIIRYTVSSRYAYIYRTFNTLEELETITIPTNMQEVKINAYEGSNKLDTVSTKLWMIKKPISIGEETVYATANNYQNYKYDSIYLEPGQFVLEGNYVSLPDANAKKSNYYFLDPNVEVKEGTTNEVVFDTTQLVEVSIDADTEGFKDVRGAILFPYNKYSSEFTKTLRVGHKFYVPANLEMDMQVQLGYGDSENDNYIWNYFLSKGTQTFNPGDKVNWQVGGSFKAFIELEKTKLERNESLSATTSIQDAYGNDITSVLVNTTSDYSIAGDQDILYKRSANGLISQEIITMNNEDYTVSHSNIPEADAKSIKPFLRIYDRNGTKVVEESSLAFYQSAEDISLSLTAGQYRAELAMAASPIGAVTSGEDEGLFTVVGSGSSSGTSTPETPEVTWSDKELTGRMTSTNNGFTYTFTEQQMKTISSSDKDFVTLTTKGGYEVKVSTDDIVSNFAGALTINLTVDGNQITFEANVNDSTSAKVAATEKTISFTNYVSISLPKTTLSSELADAVVFRVGDSTFEAVPHVVTDDAIIVKVKQPGIFTLSTQTISFDDISNDTHKNYIEELAKRNIVLGTTSETFDPNGSMTRSQFAVMVARSLDLKATSSTSFNDVEGQWYEAEVHALYEAGIIKGVNASSFNPNETITRQQAAIMISRLLTYTDVNLENADSSGALFNDIDTMSEEAKNSIMTLKELDIISGYANGNFAPYEQLTRSQMSKILYKALKVAEML